MCKCRSRNDTGMAEIEGDSSFASRARFAMVRLVQTSRDDHGAATPTELRILRQGPSATHSGSAYLLLRVHVLRGLCGEQPPQRVPQLRRRFCPSTDPAEHRAAARRVRRETSAIEPACASQIHPRRCRRAFRPGQEYSTRAALNYRHSVIPGDPKHRTRNLEIPGLVRTQLSRNDGAWIVFAPPMTAHQIAGKIVPSTSPKPTR
jgi:hypothetical protein